MEKKNRVLLLLSIWGIVLLVFNVLTFVLTDSFGSNFFCGYIFTTIAWVCCALLIWRAATQADASQSWFLNSPSLLIGILYFAIQLIAGIAIMAIPNANMKIAVSVEILVLAAALVLLLVL